MQTYILALALAGVVSSCFITNCPPGGKRSSPNAVLGHGRKCAQCGPGLRGRCVGPEICCGRDIGCFMGTREAEVCRAENLVPVLCTNDDLRSCGGASGEGRCTADGLCCTEIGCEMDNSCSSPRVPRQPLPLEDRRWAF
ncbi:oxytocin-neurophysin 1-like [Oratosquilla oratoria]|uniref:oxytocin-neurophysin 1-like n=1 Tax=Oratosquilla oratoria TaxID=337810 RepID=UPI003F772D37